MFKLKHVKLLLLILLTNFCIAQKTFTFDSISIMNGDTAMMSLKCRTTFMYYQHGFVLVSDDSRVYSYLLPDTQFFDLQLIYFYDTGKALDDSKAKGTVIIYENKYKNMQVAQFVVDKGIRLMKRNNTGILFY